MNFTSDVTLPVSVVVVGYTPAIPGRYSNRPELCEPAEPAAVELEVFVGGLDVTEALPADVLEALRAEALEQLAP